MMAATVLCQDEILDSPPRYLHPLDNKVKIKISLFNLGMFTLMKSSSAY
jgi:hypothetical protein